jgi:dolichol-phosphate mannosyltransferase
MGRIRKEGVKGIVQPSGPMVPRAVSLIIPIFNEELGISELEKRVSAVLGDEKFEFEIIVIDDGSDDSTLEELQKWRENDSRLMIVELSRNWGHQAAINAGLDLAQGDAVIFMDGDLEDPPEVIPQLLEAWLEGYNAAYAVKHSRKQGLLRKILTNIYYRLIKATTRYGVEPQAGMFSLVDKKIAKELRNIKESNKSYPNLRSYVGFKQKRITYSREPRAFGSPKQTLRSLINDGLNALFSHTYLPIRVFTIAGLLFTFLFFCLGIVIMFVKMTAIEFWIFKDIPGTQMVILIILLVGSFQIMFLGIVGEYIARIYDESKNRPYYIIDKVHKTANPKGSGEGK